NVSSDEEPLYREAERLVNSLWEKWMRMFNESGSSQEVLARVSFQFARLYLAAYNDNKQVANFLSDFERQLDEIVVAVD
ncbi:MAG: cell division protein ZapA, partial [Muribaculaceae bacterium]|nr:cell division protein ZapA [Muribaculaceae bacterium]